MTVRSASVAYPWPCASAARVNPTVAWRAWSPSTRTAMSPMSRPLVSMLIWSYTPGWANRTLRIWAMSARALSRGYGVSHDW